jgi:hypothetical protein
VDAKRLAKSRLEATRSQRVENLLNQARDEDSNRVFSGQFLEVNPNTKEVKVRLFSGQEVFFGLDFLGPGIQFEDIVQITFARGASRAIVVSKP